MKARNFLMIPIYLYQWMVRPFIGSSCRFYPSCSDYAIEALQKHGSLKGLFLITRRLLKCHPWHSGGIDYP